MGSVKAWDHRWQIKESLGEGGQGRTFLVNKVGSSTSERFVLKVLKNVSDEERRRRFATEARILSQFDHPGTSKWLDDNITNAAPREELYIVSTFINGNVLNKLSAENALERSIGITVDLLNTVEYCHRKGVLHRDIKPENIILNEASYPVLIDFGLAFDEAEGIEDTSLGQDLGNRFIVIPELRGPAGDLNDKRDTRSDLTSVVGILYYMLTGTRPGLLLDSNNALPHQREEPKQLLMQIAGAKFAKLARFFDKGFRYVPEQRYQTIDELRTGLSTLSELPKVTGPSADLDQAMQRLSNLSHFQDRQKRVQILQDLASGLSNAHQQVASSIAEQFESLQSSRNLDTAALTFRDHIGFRNIFQPEIMPMAQIDISFVGSEIVSSATYKGELTPLWRGEEADYKLNHRFQDATRAYLHEILRLGVDEFVDNHEGMPG